MTQRESRSDHNELILAWHRGATTERLDGFQAWVLAALKSALPFDHAIWCLGIGPRRGSSAAIHSAYVHASAAPPSAVQSDLVPFDQMAHQVARQKFNLVRLCQADPVLHGPHLAAWNTFARHLRLAHLACAVDIAPRSGSLQTIIIGRHENSPCFTAAEMETLELLTPHMMQAYTTRRELLINSNRPVNGQPITWATAVVDRAGNVHNRDSDFADVLAREWADLDEGRLPEPLRTIAASGRSTQSRYVGSRIMVEFSPAKDLYLISARPRLPDDALSERERNVAHHYAAGASYKEIARTLQLSPATVRAHVRTVFLKLGVRKKAHLAGLLN